MVQQAKPIGRLQSYLLLVVAPRVAPKVAPRIAPEGYVGHERADDSMGTANNFINTVDVVFKTNVTQC